MSWDWTRVTRGLALAAWGGFFVWLWVSGEATTYIGPKTSWVVTLGAVTLPVVALAYLWAARRGPRTPSTRELAANTLLVAPVLFALMVPAPSLGALAAKNKSTKNAAAPIAPAPPDGEIGVLDIAWAAESPEAAEQVLIKAGEKVDIVGFISSRDERATQVARFFVSCCAADGTAYAVNVKGVPAELPIDAWVQVKGVLAGTPGVDFHVAATSVIQVEKPDNPYN